MLRRLLLGSLVACALVLLLEAAARVAGIGGSGAKVVLEDAGDGRVRLRALGISTETPHVSPDFAREKRPGAVRIALFGESAAAGFPYGAKSTPARWLEEALRAQIDGLDVEVVDAAIAGIDGEWMQDAARAVLPLGVDVAIVYAGNNEFLESYIRRRAAALDSRAMALARWLERRSALVRGLEHLLRGTEALPATRSPLNPIGALEPPLGPLGDAILAATGEHLAGVLREARARGVTAIVVRPLARGVDCPPMSSAASRPLAPSERDALAAALDEAHVALREGDLERAGRALAAGEAVDAGVALLEYRRAEWLLASHRPEAPAAFERALDLDERPVRVNARTAAVLERTARAEGAAWLDLADLRAAGCDAAQASGLLIDHCHLTIEGQWRLASRLAAELRALGPPRLRDALRAKPPLEFADGLAALRISVSEALLPEVQLGFTSLLCSRQFPATAADHVDLARRTFERVLAKYPAQPKALCGMGFVAAATGATEEAVARFEAAKAAAPRVMPEVARMCQAWPALQQMLAEAGLEFGVDGIQRLSR